MENIILSVSHLSKEFDSLKARPFFVGFKVGSWLESFWLKEKFRAVDDISFEVKEGEILGLLGPNGAGKTTTINMLLGITTPTSGTIEVFGKEFNKDREEILRQVNFCSSYVYLPWRLTVAENLRVFGGLYEVGNLEKRIDEVLEIFEARDLKNKKISQLSAGQRTRVMLAKSFLNKPRLLFLDEPTASLDPDVSDKTRKYLLELQEREKITILFTSHNMTEIEEVCDRVIFLNHGKIIAEDTPEGLAARSKKVLVNLFVLDGLKRTESYAQKMGLNYTTTQRSISIETEEKDIAKFLQDLAVKGVSYKEITIDKPSLEDFFLEVTRSK